MSKPIVAMLKEVDNPVSYIRNHFNLYGDNKVIYKLKDGMKVYLRPKTTDNFIFNEIFLHKCYTPQGFEINEGDIVIDIGAHIGLFTLFASRFKPKKIHAFEPFKENFDLLEYNIKENNIRNVETYNIGVSDSLGEKEFFVSKGKNKGGNSLYEKENCEKIKIRTFPFTSVIGNIDKIDFLKLDCEGAEYDILFSLGFFQMRKIKKVSMEYHNVSEYHHGLALKSYLEMKGYEVIMIPFGEKRGHIYAKQKEGKK